jgi:hypothetical protein
MWYCVHALLHFESNETNQNNQTETLVWEHMYLIEAHDPDEARDKGEVRARKDESSPSDHVTLDGQPARLRFATIRKVVECQDLDPKTNAPADGTELSYSEYIASPAQWPKLMDAETADVKYLGDDGEADEGQEGDSLRKS